MQTIQLDIESKKTEIKNLIKTKMKVSRKTNFKKQAGIYLLYIDDFSDEKIIPIYIGKTLDLQKKYQIHISEFLALNRLYSHHYEYTLLDDFYDQDHETIKMFQYMVDHDCKLTQIKMIILNKMSQNKDKIFKAELKWINNTESPYLGFNQFNTVTQLNRLKSLNKYDSHLESQNCCKLLHDDCKKIIQLWDYGYTEFNFLQGFPSVDDLYYWEHSYKLELNQVFNEVLELFDQKYPEDYKRYYRLKLEIKRDKAMKKSLIKSKASKKYINKFDNTVKNKMEAINDGERTLKLNRNQSLLPHKKYSIYPLGYLYDFLIHPPIDELSKIDSCYINVKISNSGTDEMEPDIIMIECVVYLDGQSFNRQFFIANEATTFLDKDDFCYIEKDLAHVSFKREPFHPIAFIGKVPFKHMISIESEYKTGMNDLLFWRTDKVELEEALLYLEIHTNEKTKFLVESSESQCCLEKSIPQKFIHHPIVKIMLDSMNHI